MGIDDKEGLSKPTQRLTILGLVFTFLYISVLLITSILHLDSMRQLGPSEWGNFLAGVFGPLGFLWLVLGFFQQRDELRHSAQALWLQSEELRNSVEQQRALVDATREQIDMEREAADFARDEKWRRERPLIKITCVGGRYNNVQISRKIKILNHGASCTQVVAKITTNIGDSLFESSFDMLERGEAVNFDFSSERDTKFCELHVYISFLSLSGDSGIRQFIIEDIDEQNLDKFRFIDLTDV